MMPYFCIPQCGVYGHEDYHMALPLLLVHLPSGPVIQKGSLYHCLPVELQAVLNQNMATQPSQLDVLLTVHSRPCFENGIDPSLQHINLLFHTWAFQGVDLAITPEISDDVVMGIFGPNGVHEVAQDIVEELNGVPVQRTGKLVVYIHGGARFSPHNAQLGLDDDVSVHSFFSYGYQPHTGRSVVTFHLMCSNENGEAPLKKCLTGCKDVGEVVANFDNLSNTRPEFTAHLTSINNLLQSCNDYLN
ncbi:uncharacterized protein [Dysidea avara]